MNRKKLAVGIAGGAAVLSLIGVGAGASFTDAVAATQSVQAGTLNMTVAGPAGSSTDGKTVTLAATSPENSTFTTGPQLITTTNSGNITANSILLSASDVNNNAAFQSELYVEIDSWSGPNQTGALNVAYNGPLNGLLEHGGQAIAGPIAAGQTDPFYVTFYAGTNGQNSQNAGDVGYGNSLDNAPALDSAAEGGTVIPKITVTYQG
jgi:predicted ribosomally synthesized peptide with SipW-like signal peptide